MAARQSFRRRKCACTFIDVHETLESTLRLCLTIPTVTELDYSGSLENNEDDAVVLRETGQIR